MEKTDDARKGRIVVNMKEKVYIYSYKRNNTLRDGQKADENNHKNSLLHIIQHAHTILSILSTLSTLRLKTKTLKTTDHTVIDKCARANMELATGW
jgi:hypothetical protein